MKKSLSIHCFLAFSVLLTFISLSCSTRSTRSEDEKWVVVFLSDRTGVGGIYRELYTMKSDGTDQKRLGQTWAIHLRGRDPLWSPDKRKIAFAQATKSNSWIMMINSDGSGLDTLVREPGVSFVTLGDWSPDGNKLVYHLDAHMDTSKSGIYVISPDGSGKMRLDRGDEPRFCGNDRVVYAREDGIFIIGTNGEGKRKLQQALLGSGLHKPVGSSDGNKVAFYRVLVTPHPYEKCWLEMMNSDGSGHTKLAQINDVSGFAEIEFSPDNKRILFLAGNGANGEIYVVNIDGSGFRALTNNNAVAEGGARWSPDGRQIAFTSEKDGNQEIYTMNTFGSAYMKRLTNNSADDTNPDW
ncbi:MAG: PD40 domain-containing protein [candidate division Zixibacteria bacterium]|nr:PD40 domain-containing protein [candidate division Zixibacteria bacterium]